MSSVLDSLAWGDGKWMTEIDELKYNSKLFQKQFDSE